MVVLITAITYRQGKLINAVTSTYLWRLVLLFFALRTIMINVEEIYIVGMEGTSMERRELISFIYRALLWFRAAHHHD